MGKTGVLGAFEELVLLAVHRQGAAAYGVSIRRELVDRTGSEVTMGSVYATLDRLEEKGFVRYRRGEDTESRRGRPRRYVDLLPAGVRELRRTRRVRDTMWDGVDLDGLSEAEAK